jgi:ATP-binding cassette subfamily B protein
MLLKDFLSLWARRILMGTSREIEADLRNDLLAQFMKFEPEFYIRNRTGDLMSRATNDLNAVRMVLGPGLLYVATMTSTMVIAIYFMTSLSPTLTLCVLLPVPLVAIVDRYFGEKIHRLSEQIQTALGALSTRAQENFTGVRVVRAYTQERQEMERFDDANCEYRTKNIQLIGVWSVFFPVLAALVGVTFVILLCIGGRQVMNHQISVGTLWAFYAFLVQFAWPMVALGWVTNIFQRGAASASRLNYILNAEPKVNDADSSQNLKHAAVECGFGRSQIDVRAEAIGTNTSIRGEIEFRNLTFSYPTSSNGPENLAVLRDINLRIPAGSTLAVVGPTGSAKSTLVALVARLWEAPPGTLLLDGRPIQEYPLDELRRTIGYVPQDTFLFSDTIRENIAFGVNDPLEDHIYAAAEIACISEEIQGFPEQFETIVGERGATLSGGQRQRAALARAILRQPKILVLDDALSSVDTETEKKILRRLRDVMRQCTTILVSHRVSTIKSVDRIVVLREGQIVERGTHAELVELGGYYADLQQKQLLEEELERE